MAKERPITEYTFKKKEKLKNSRDFKRVCFGGERVKTRNFIVYALLNNLGLPRLGLTVSAKTANSPNRSRIKRLLREFFRFNKILFTNQSSELSPGEPSPPVTLSAPAGHVVPGSQTNTLDVVIIAKKAAARDGLKATTEELSGALTKLNRLIANRSA
ncbi:MAG: ribonuclease P protein component [Thermodesulfobacteriota bacterium]